MLLRRLHEATISCDETNEEEVTTVTLRRLSHALSGITGPELAVWPRCFAILICLAEALAGCCSEGEAVPNWLPA